MTKRKTTEEFIKQAKEVHGDKYDYSLVNYINWCTKVEIKCPIHGTFKQSPLKHVQGQDCGFCKGEKISKAQSSNTNEFIEKANKKHNFRYDYSLVSYINNSTKIKITCKDHGEFLQTPGSHINGNGCPKCKAKQTSERSLFSIDIFLERAKNIHGDKYDYSQTIYNGADNYLNIICKKHGIFKQTAQSHLNGCGCQKCYYERVGDSLRYSLEEFIQKAVDIHGTKYNYSFVNYINSDTKVIIVCPVHGEFKQQPGNHLQGQNCPRCTNIVSRPSNAWLSSLRVPDDKNHREVKRLIPGRRYIVDGYMPETNTVYEFYGDKIHGNPKKYKAENINSINKKTFGECYRKTMEKEKAIKDAGYNLISIWESDFRQQQIDLANSRI